MANPKYPGDPSEFENLIQNGYEFRLNDYINKGWDLFKRYPWGFFFFGLIFLALQGIGGSMQNDGGSGVSIVLSILSAPLAAGFYIVARMLDRGEKPEFGDFFKGFNDFVPLVLSNILVTFFIVLGMIFLIAPGIYLAIAYTFVVPMIIFARMNFWPAMETSRKLISKNWWNFLVMGLVALGFVILGALVVGIGVAVAIPVIYCMYYAAWDDITGGEVAGQTLEDKIEEIGQEEDL